MLFNIGSVHSLINKVTTLGLAIIAVCLCATTHAAEIYEVHSNARAMSLGGAYAALVSDEESLWYNPAGIARNGGFFWTIADPLVGISDPEAMTQFADLGSAATFESTLNNVYGEPIWIGGRAKSSVIVPYFAAAYFYDVDGSIIVDNPVSPTMDTRYISDTGIAIGSGWSIGGLLQMGFAIKYIDRTGSIDTWDAATIASIVGGVQTPDVIFDSFSATQGTGYSLDYGMNLSLPGWVQPTVSFVWKNIGDTKFRPAAGEPAPPSAEDDMTIGGSLLVDLPLVSIAPVLEIRHLNEGTEPIMKKVHMGLELGLPLVDLRVGLYQGYYTAGLGLGLGFFDIEAATWGTELGGYPGQFESRRYMVQMTMRFGFDFGLGSGAGSGSSASGGGSGSSSGKGGSGGSGSSRFGGRKLKQRR